VILQSPRYFDDVKKEREMHIRKSVLGEVVSVRGVHDNSVVTLEGATFPSVPLGTNVEMLALRVPEGLHALALLEEQRDRPEDTQINLLLSWQEGDKRFVKDDSEMSAREIARFNPFVRSTRDILVINPEQGIVYCSDLEGHKESADPAWVHAFISAEEILLYITKRLTLNELDERVVSEIRVQDELKKLRDENSQLSDARDYYERLHSREVTDRINVTSELEGSIGLYRFLKRLPVWLRPSWFIGFFGAMDLLFENQDDSAYS
jgi:hypothetical protein